MQTEIAFISSGLSTIVSTILATYLIQKWYHQKARLPFDLPLMFGVVFVASALSQLFKSATLIGFIPDTLEMFRLRTFVIAWVYIPWSLVLMRILWPSGEKWHIRLWGMLTAVSVGVSLFAPTQAIMQTYHTVWILIIIIGVIVTFSVTWKTGRLKEVRSELVVIASILAVISQVGQIIWAAAGLTWIGDVFTVFSVTLYTIALINPWYKREVASPILEPVYMTG
ncbi:hypothetical protein EU522_00110 [Candidatus Thorarchaeota archaeon]|nr:MAG: hypothetical protein EU522_00110 [Candidatus Thorarchaeota archaeon]